MDSPSIFVGADKLNNLTVCQEDTTHDASAQGDASHDDGVCVGMCTGYIVSSSSLVREPDGNSVRQDTGYGVSLVEESARLVSDAASV